MNSYPETEKVNGLNKNENMINWTKIRLKFVTFLSFHFQQYYLLIQHFFMFLSFFIKYEKWIWYFLTRLLIYGRKKTLLFFWALKFNKFIILCLWIIFSPHYSILIKSFWNEKKQLLHSIICPSIPLSLINKSYLLIVIDIATFLIHC